MTLRSAQIFPGMITIFKWYYLDINIIKILFMSNVNYSCQEHTAEHRRQFLSAYLQYGGLEL